MRRTRALMATVTTSLMLTGANTAADSLPLDFGQVAPTTADPWKTDAQVGQAADELFNWLKETKIESAKTVAEIEKHFTGLTSVMVNDALKRLVYESRIKRTGDGSKATPYKYYARSSSVD